MQRAGRKRKEGARLQTVQARLMDSSGQVRAAAAVAAAAQPASASARSSHSSTVAHSAPAAAPAEGLTWATTSGSHEFLTRHHRTQQETEKSNQEQDRPRRCRRRKSSYCLRFSGPLHSSDKK